MKYAELGEPEREQAVRRLMEAGGSNKSVGKELSVSPNTIASYRYRKGIPSTNAAPPMGRPRKKRKPSRILNVPGLRESPSEAARCEAKGLHCPYEAKVGTPFCPLHQTKKQ